MTGATAPHRVGLGRNSEQETVPIPLLHSVAWIARSLVWTEMCKSVRKGPAQVSVKDCPCSLLIVLGAIFIYDVSKMVIQ